MDFAFSRFLSHHNWKARIWQTSLGGSHVSYWPACIYSIRQWPTGERVI